MLGLKIENVRAIANTEMTLGCPVSPLPNGTWRPRDVVWLQEHSKSASPEMVEARKRVYTACKEAGVAFLEGGDKETLPQRIDGV